MVQLGDGDDWLGYSALLSQADRERRAAEAGHDNKPKTAALFARNIYCARRFDCFSAMHPEQLDH